MVIPLSASLFISLYYSLEGNGKNLHIKAGRKTLPAIRREMVSEIRKITEDERIHVLELLRGDKKTREKLISWFPD